MAKTQERWLDPETRQQLWFEPGEEPVGWVRAEAFHEIERRAKKAQANYDRELDDAEKARHRKAQKAIELQTAIARQLKRDLKTAKDPNRKNNVAEELIKAKDRLLQMKSDEAVLCQNAYAAKLQRKAERIEKEKQRAEALDKGAVANLAHRVATTMTLDLFNRGRFRKTKEAGPGRGNGAHYTTHINPETGDTIKLLPGDEVPDGFIPGTRKGLAKLKARAARKAEGTWHRSEAVLDHVRTRVKERLTGTKWFNNPETGELKRLDPDGDIPAGFVAGRPGLGKWFNNPETGEKRRINAGEDVPANFIPGRGPTK